jgi:hypothetical protein
MINIDEVNSIRKEKIADEFQERSNELNQNIDEHRQLFLKVLTSKDEAEQSFPDILANLENRIKRAINSRTTGTFYTYDSTSKDAFIVSMLISTLTLSGFVCKLRGSDNKLDISW